jgi:hypothetical protein
MTSNLTYAVEDLDFLSVLAQPTLKTVKEPPYNFRPLTGFIL